MYYDNRRNEVALRRYLQEKRQLLCSIRALNAAADKLKDRDRKSPLAPRGSLLR